MDENLEEELWRLRSLEIDFDDLQYKIADLERQLAVTERNLESALKHVNYKARTIESSDVIKTLENKLKTQKERRQEKKTSDDRP